MKTLKAISKQLLGARYEHISKSLFACFIIFFAVYNAEIRVTTAPAILFLTATFFSLGVMWRALSSAQNAEKMMGLFMLPFENKKLIVSYLLAFGSYTVITKTILVLALFFAIGTWSAEQILTAVLCACNGCAMAAAWYSMLSAKKRIPVILWGCGIFFSIFFVKQLPVFCGIVLVSLLTTAMCLLSADAYTFYQPVSAKKIISRTKGKANVLLYLLRYLAVNKSYLINTAGLWVIACFLPLLFGHTEGLNMLPLGFAILCLNTPVCILLSCDPGLEQAVRALPGQAARFGSRYCFFLFAVNMAANSIYLISWQISNGSVCTMDIVTAVLFALQSAVLSVLLEWLHPIRNWKIENDLWHHPRKYIVPLFMMLTAVLTGTWPFIVWILLCIVLAECLGLILITRRL